MTVPQGWYPDSGDPSRQSYWNGTGWSSEWRSAQHELHSQPAFPPGWFSDANVFATPHYWDGQKWTKNTRPIAVSTPPGDVQRRGITADTIIFVLVVLFGVVYWVNTSDAFKSDAWKRCVADQRNAFPDSHSIPTTAEEKIEDQCTEQHGG